MEYLIGIDYDDCIVFAEPEKDADGRFTCSFDIVRPFAPGDDLDDMTQEYLEEMDVESKWDFCERYDCKPSEMGEQIPWYEQMEMLYDTSLYPNIITCDDRDWYFESVECGQADSRRTGIKELTIPKEIFNKLMYLGDNYHLEKLPESETKMYEEIIKALEEDEPYEEDLIRMLIEKYIINEEK